MAKSFGKDTAGPWHVKLPDGTDLKRDAHTLETTPANGTTKVTVLNNDGSIKQEIQLDANRSYIDASGVKRQYLSQTELSTMFRESEAVAPKGLGELPAADIPGLLTGRKFAYHVELQQINSVEHPRGVELSTREARLVTEQPLKLQTDKGEVELPKGTALPIGTQIDRASGQIITPEEGIRLEGGQIARTQSLDVTLLSGGQHLKPGDKDPGDWVIIRRTMDDFGNPIYDSYHQSDVTKQKKWDLVAGSTYAAKTDENKNFILMPNGDITISPSYGGVASNDGLSVLVKDKNGFYFNGIDELKQTHIGSDPLTQATIDRAWAKTKAERTGGYWDEKYPDRYVVTQPDGNWRSIGADGKIITKDAPGPWEVKLKDGTVVKRESTSELLQKAPVTVAAESLDESPRAVESGSIQDLDKTKQVVIRTEHRQMEIMAADFHKLTPFESAIPETAQRTVASLGPEAAAEFPDSKTVDVQERIGFSLDDHMKRSTLTGMNEQLRDQLEQATAERAIIGDYDVNLGNITASNENGQWTVGNIDLDKTHGAFGIDSVPTVNSPLAGKLISSSTLEKLDAMVKKLDTPEGRQSLKAIGLNDEQANALLLRAHYLLEHKQFPESFEKAVADPNLDPKYLEQLVKSTNYRTQKLVALNPALTPDMMKHLLDTNDRNVLKSLVLNPSLTPELMDRIWQGRMGDVKELAVATRKLAPEQLKEAAESSWEKLRLAAAKNSSLDPELLKTLAKDPEFDVRKAVAENPSTPESVLRSREKRKTIQR